MTIITGYDMYMRKGGTMLVQVTSRRFYEVKPEAYGYCPYCDMTVDSWRYANPRICPACNTPVMVVGHGSVLEQRMRMNLTQCEQDGCFNESFAYPVPLRPVMLLKQGDVFVDEYGGERITA